MQCSGTVSAVLNLQNLAEDWTIGSTGCYDAASLARLQSTLRYDFRAVADGNCDTCLNLLVHPAVRQQLTSETLRADASALGKLMADHTQVPPAAVLCTYPVCLCESCAYDTVCRHGVTLAGILKTMLGSAEEAA